MLIRRLKNKINVKNMTLVWELLWFKNSRVCGLVIGVGG